MAEVAKIPQGLHNEKWYRVFDKQIRCALLLEEGTRCIMQNSLRRDEALCFASVFDGLEMTSFDATGYQYDNPDVFPGLEAPIIKNTLRSIGQTTVSKLAASDQPYAQFMTNRGGWKEITKATKMDRLVQAEVERPQGHFNTLHEVHRHGATLAINVTGSYAVFFFPTAEGIRCELDDTLALGVDQSGRFGNIVALVRVVYYNADQLASDFPDFEDEIFSNEKILPDGSMGFIGVRGEYDQSLRPRRGVKVTQGWFCSYLGKPGARMYALEDGTILLDDRKWKRATPPWVKWDYERELYGVWGVPQSRTTYQQCMRENRMLCDADNAERNSPQCVMLLPVNAEQEGDLDEARGWAIVRTNVDPSKVIMATPPKYNQMTLDFVDRMNQGAHEVSGVSDQHTSARKAQGTTSGKHEHLVAALFTERFADAERRLIQCRAIDTAKQLVFAFEELVQNHPSFSRVWANGDDSEELKPADLDLDVSKYTITVAAVSEDKDSPAARLDKADEWLQMGIITGSEWASIQQTLATQEQSEMLTTQQEWVAKQIYKWCHDDDDKRLEEGWYQGPEKWDDLPAELRQVSLAKKRAQMRGAPPDVLQWFDKFLAEASAYHDEDIAQQNAKLSVNAPMSSVFPSLGGAAPQPGAASPEPQTPTTGTM